jgi:hypothetical protein
MARRLDWDKARHRDLARTTDNLPPTEAQLQLLARLGVSTPPPSRRAASEAIRALLKSG